MVPLQFSMRAVKSACRGLAGAAARRAIPKDGSDATPMRVSFLGNNPNPGLMPLWASTPKYEITWEVEEGDTGDFTGRIFWTLLGYKGYFPAVTDYVGDVPQRAHATYFPNEELAKNCASNCADILRQQFASAFHQEGNNAGQGQI